MDFKLCGTEQGITGFQLDLKLAGIPLNLLEEEFLAPGRTPQDP